MKALSREIKFRVYNTDWKMMVLPEDIYYIKFQGEKSEATDVAFNITTTDGMRNNNIWENPEDIVFMQYTGLHDKNGKEIYEGDIVADRSHTDLIFAIEYDNEHAGYYMPEAFEEECRWPISEVELEIIGNIYESKHLLDNTDTKG